MAAVARSTKMFKSWSYSRYMSWRQCSLRAKLEHLVKLPTPKNDAMKRGADLHDGISAYLLGKTKVPPIGRDDHLDSVRALLDELRERKKRMPETLLVEEDWGFKRDWSETAWDDWDGCWLRMKVDAGWLETPAELVIVDWKSGKFRDTEVPAYAEQLELYAAGALSRMPLVEVVRPKLVYVDLGFTYDGRFNGGKLLEFRRKDLPKLQRAWEKRVGPMLLDTKFPPKPSNLCRWCPFTKAAGGPCQY